MCVYIYIYIERERKRYTYICIIHKENDVEVVCVEAALQVSGLNRYQGLNKYTILL